MITTILTYCSLETGGRAIAAFLRPQTALACFTQGMHRLMISWPILLLLAYFLEGSSPIIQCLLSVDVFFTFTSVSFLHLVNTPIMHPKSHTFICVSHTSSRWHVLAVVSPPPVPHSHIEAGSSLRRNFEAPYRHKKSRRLCSPGVR